MLGEKWPCQTHTIMGRKLSRGLAGPLHWQYNDGNPVEIRHGMTLQQRQAALFQVYGWCNPPTRGMATSLGRAAFLPSMGLGVGASLSSESWMRSA